MHRSMIWFEVLQHSSLFDGLVVPSFAPYEPGPQYNLKTYRACAEALYQRTLQGPISWQASRDSQKWASGTPQKMHLSKGRQSQFSSHEISHPQKIVRYVTHSWLFPLCLHPLPTLKAQPHKSTNRSIQYFTTTHGPIVNCLTGISHARLFFLEGSKILQVQESLQKDIYSLPAVVRITRCIRVIRRGQVLPDLSQYRNLPC